jgi:hypothetical protein
MENYCENIANPAKCPPKMAANQMVHQRYMIDNTAVIAFTQEAR